MKKDNKEIVFEIITGLIVIVGIYTENKYVLFFSLFPVCVSLWFWYNDNIVYPIKSLEEKTKELYKDLNTRKEIEDMKMKLSELTMIIRENKKGGLNPFLFIMILVLIIIIMMYLRDKGFI